jgi:single-strand DNA-binding protein
MSEIELTTVGHLTRDPELSFTPSGQGVAKFQVAVTPRKKQGDQWIDGETTFLACEAWGDLGEHVAESLTRGTQVLVQGVLRTQRWKDRQTNEDRERVYLRVDDIGPSLRWATTKVTKATRSGAGQLVGAAQGAGSSGAEPPPF